MIELLLSIASYAFVFLAGKYYGQHTHTREIDAMVTELIELRDTFDEISGEMKDVKARAEEHLP